MDDRRKTLIAITIIIGFILVILLGATLLISRRRSLSPVPDEGAIKIIFISPTPFVASPSATLTPSVTAKPTATPKPTPKPTVKSTATPTPKPTTSATPTTTGTTTPTTTSSPTTTPSPNP